MSQPTSSPQYGPSNPSPAEHAAMPTQRFGAVIQLHPEKEAYYRKLHAHAWPSVLARLQASNIHNFIIFRHQLEGKTYLFNYFEHHGEDLEGDMQAIAADPETQRWWKETDPCQIRLPDAKDGENWSPMEMLFLME
ncbi:L-rhamnose mutarotase [Rubritalea marina]|uniref:L-rhamnose mutarotase n=1 Tax=Rubritalea marina TaxID=361055 RepID=UPI00037A94AE|nr:L-rhamnose mutarotase [Rubritalea marina]